MSREGGTKAQPTEAVALTDGQLKALQGVLLEMLLELDRVCRKNGIRYSISGGTLLGAVRHGGFIPWDDDVDTVMLREDYDRFRAACKTDLDHEKYFFQDHTTDPHYPWGYGRLRRKNSEFVRVGQEHLRMRTGIFLDIFLADGIPDGTLAKSAVNACCFVLRKLLYAETGAVAGKAALVRGWYRLLSLVPRWWTFRRLEELADRCNKRHTRFVRNYTFPPPKGKHTEHLRRWSEQVSPILFEGHPLLAYQECEAYLTYKFGDWQTPPDENRRHTHPVSAFRLPPQQEPLTND